MKTKLGQQSGFAMLTALFLILAITLAISNAFINLSGNQKQSSRSDAKIVAQAAALSAIDASVHEIQKYVSEHAHAEIPFPLTDTDDKVEGSVLLNIANNFKLAYPDAGPIHLESVEIKEVAPSDALGKTYEIRVRTKDAYNQAQSQMVQKVRMNRGSLYDFAVYSGKDLEFAPGPNATIQGPVFSNGNIFISTGIDSEIVFKQPDLLNGDPPPDRIDYVLGSAKNIYFGFKPVVARNYVNLVSPQVKNAYDDEYGGNFRGYYDPKLNHGAEIPPGQETSQNPLPRIYFMKNQVLDMATNLLQPNKYSIYIEKRDLARTRTRLGFSDFYRGNYYYEFHLRPSLISFHVGNYYGGPKNCTLDGIGNQADDCKMSLSGATGPDTFSQLDFSTPNPADPPLDIQLNAANTALDVKDYDPLVNPEFATWRTQQNGLKRDSSEGEPLILERAPIASIPLGDLPTGTTPHILIEPVSKDDSLSVIGQKFETKADLNGLKVLCIDSNCTQLGFFVKGKGGNPGEWGLTEGAQCFEDKRLNGRFRVQRVNLSELVAKWKQEKLGTSGVFYFQTKPFSELPPQSGEKIDASGDCAGLPVRMVILENGTKLLNDGMTFVTNGRMWVNLSSGGGNFNVVNRIDLSDAFANTDETRTHCVIDNEVRPDQKWPNCHVPPVALISDSFGVFETEIGSLAYGEGNVDRDYILNAAVVTGQLASTLERTSKKCDGKPKTFTNLIECFDNTLGIDGHPWLGNNINKDFFEISQYAPHTFGGVSLNPNYYTPPTEFLWLACPKGLNEDGTPIDRRECNIFFNPDKATFHYRRVTLIRQMLEDLKLEVALYQTFRTDYPGFNLPPAPISTIPLAVNNPPEEPEEGSLEHYIERARQLELLVTDYSTGRGSVETFRSEVIGLTQSMVMHMPVLANVPVDSRGINRPAGTGSTTDYQKILYYAANEPVDEANKMVGLMKNVAGNNPIYPQTSQLKPGSTTEYEPSTLNWYPEGENSFNPNDSASGSALSNAAFFAANRLDQRQIYWREVKIDFTTVPTEWPIPMNAHHRYFDHHDSQVKDSLNKRVHAAHEEPIASPMVNGVYFNMMHIPSLRGIVYMIIADLKLNRVCSQGQIGDETNPGTIQRCTHEYTGFHLLGIRDAHRYAQMSGDAEAPVIDGVSQNLQPYVGRAYGGAAYEYGRTQPLYDVRYSGGLENLINLQDKWQYETGPVDDKQPVQRKLHFSGTMTVPWDAKELIKRRAYTLSPCSGSDCFGPAYWNSNPKPDYTAPERFFDYNESLSSSPPPSTPSVFGLKRFTVKYEKMDE